MIPNKMITKLAKAYTKKTIAKEGLKVSKTAWSNGNILFWETPPDFVANHYAKSEVPSLDTITIPQDMPTMYPTEIRYHDASGFTLVKMTDGNGRTHWLDGHYVSAALQQAKRKAQNVSFAFCAADTEGKSVTGIIAQVLDHPIALISPMDETFLPLENAPDWQIINEDLPMPVYHGQPEYIDPDLVTQFRLL